VSLVAVVGSPLTAAAIANDPWLMRFRTTLVAILGGAVMGIACLAFYTSFEAIRSYAVRSQGIAPEHGWAVPLLVDSFIVVATGADLWFTTTKTRRAWWEVWWPKLLLAGAAGVSFVLNVAHAEPTWAARGVAAIPPAALVLGVELLMMVLRRATTLRAARLQAELDAQQAAAMEAPVQRARIQIEAMRRTRPGGEELTAPSPRAGRTEARAGALSRPAGESGGSVRPARPGGSGGALAAPLVDREPQRAGGADTFRDAVAAARGDDGVRRPARPSRPDLPIAASVRADATTVRPGRDPAGAERSRPYVVAARILDERADADSLTPEALMEALASRGVTANLSTAQALLRELRPPLSTRISPRRPAPPGAEAAGNGDRRRAPRPR
jgi:hypothetical protein